MCSFNLDFFLNIFGKQVTMALCIKCFVTINFNRLQIKFGQKFDI